MSDSEVDVPSAASVSKAIRDVVISIHKAGNDDDLTVNHVRTAAEQKLGIPAGFLKNGDWKNESKTLIKEAVVRFFPSNGAVGYRSHDFAARRNQPAYQLLPLCMDGRD